MMRFGWSRGFNRETTGRTFHIEGPEKEKSVQGNYSQVAL